MDDLVHSKRRTIVIAGIKFPWPSPIAYALGSSSAMVFGHSVYGTNAPKYIKFFHRVFCKIQDAKYWLLYRFHPKHCYHLIDTKLGYGYHERDDQFLYGAMACLIGYVEDCEWTGCHDPGDEARAILHWWKVERPADQAQYDTWLHELYGNKEIKTKPVEGSECVEIVFDPMSDEDEAKQKAMWALKDKIENDEQTYLHRLVDIRPGMWT